MQPTPMMLEMAKSDGKRFYGLSRDSPKRSHGSVAASRSTLFLSATLTFRVSQLNHKPFSFYFKLSFSSPP